MKPKQTQVLGLLITLLLSLIIYDFYIIYSINAYIKLDQSDVTTSFAIVDALFFQVIKLIIISYGIFALFVEIRGIYILRERLKAKLEAKTKSMYEQCKDSLDRTNTMINKEYAEPNKTEQLYKDFEANAIRDNVFSPKDLLDEIHLQGGSANLNFEPIKTKETYQDIHLDRYGKDALDSLTRGQYLNLSVANIDARLRSLKILENWYKNTSPSGVADIYRKYWDNCVVDINFTKTLG